VCKGGRLTGLYDSGGSKKGVSSELAQLSLKVGRRTGEASEEQENMDPKGVQEIRVNCRIDTQRRWGANEDVIGVKPLSGRDCCATEWGSKRAGLR